MLVHARTAYQALLIAVIRCREGDLRATPVRADRLGPAHPAGTISEFHVHLDPDVREGGESRLDANADYVVAA